MFRILRMHKGFSLVEVLAVIVILGVIASIAVLTIGNLVEKQRVNAAKAEWNHIQEAAKLFALDDDRDTDGDGEFTFHELLNADYLTGFEGELKI
ncbi:prepilin-type N-terminal cleavage/methylation domain-containing protein [Mycoplasmatota bacterium]|nr:prepilin-type N-terminal cleavage/methylation domain-containing protein [Mycoplasmatota bacterium]